MPWEDSDRDWTKRVECLALGAFMKTVEKQVSPLPIGGHMFQSLDVDQRAHAYQTFCSWERGWRSLLLRRFTGHAEAEDAVIPPVAEHAIVLVTRGEADMESGSEGSWTSAAYRPGTIAMTAPNRPTRLRWRTVSPDPHENIQVYLPAGTITRMVEELWDRDPRHMPLPDTLATTDPLLEQTMLTLFQAAQNGVPDLYAETAVEFIAAHTLMQHGSLPPTPTFGNDDQRIRRARTFLRENLHLPLTLAEIASEASMSRYHFVGVFQAQTGETPYRYLSGLRIERAKHQLQHASATISEIAGQCGFTSSAYFSTVFRRQTGYTPSAYRRLHRKPVF